MVFLFSDRLRLFVQAPLAAAFAGDVEKYKAIGDRQLAAINGWEKVGIHLVFPMKLAIGDGHGTAGKKCCPTGPKSYGNQDATDEFNDTAKPKLAAEFRAWP